MINKRNLLGAVVATVALLGIAAPAMAAPGKNGAAVRLAGKEISIVPELTEALGFFKAEGVDVALVKDTEFEGPHYMIQRAMHKNEIDMAVHWYQHAWYGQREGHPTKALMVFNDAPLMTVLVANSVKDRVHSAKDFKGLRIAEGAGYSTKSMILNTMARRAGLSLPAYTPVIAFVEGRQEATIKALDNNEVDIIAFREPMASAIVHTGKVSTLWEMNTGKQTEAVLGATFAGQSLLSSPAYIKSHPDKVARVTRAMVRTMRWINAHSADEIMAKLPDSALRGKKRADELVLLKSAMGTYRRDNYAITPSMEKLMTEMVDGALFDDSVEGKFRRGSGHLNLPAGATYDDSFVNKAMKQIR